MVAGLGFVLVLLVLVLCEELVSDVAVFVAVVVAVEHMRHEVVPYYIPSARPFIYPFV
jgi:hypothetical protein